MTAFSYSAKQQAALLGTLVIIDGIKPSEIVGAVTKAARRAIENKLVYGNAPLAADVIRELAETEDRARYLSAAMRDVTADIEQTPTSLRTLRAMMRKKGLDIPPAKLIDDLDALVEAAGEAQQELSGNGLFGSPFLKHGVLVYREAPDRKSRQGRPPNFALLHFSVDLAFVFRLATGKRPTSVKSKSGGPMCGPFRDFLDAAVRPTDLLPTSRRVDSLADRARREFEFWRRTIRDGIEGQNGSPSEDAALQMVAGRLGITWPAPSAVVTKFPAKRAN